MSSRYVVTGATDFLGGALARALRAEGHAVTAVGRDAARSATLAADGLRVVRCDLTTDDLAPILGAGVDAVIHCAALSAPFGPTAAFRAANVVATQRLVAAAARHGCGHFVFISSPSVYFRPRDQFALDEGVTLPAPVNAYAWSKGEGERIVREAPELHASILRPRGLYGRGDKALLPRLLAACQRGPLPLLRGGMARTDLTHVGDAIDAIKAVLAAGPPPATRTFNISGGEAVTIRRIVEEAATRAGIAARWQPLPWRPFLAAVRVNEAIHRLIGATREPRITRYTAGLFAFSQTLDLTRITTATGWRPRIPFASGLDRTFG